MDKKCNPCGWLFAFLVLSSLIFWNTCSNKSSPNSPDDGETYSETPALRAFSDSLVVAFESGNKDSVLAFVNPEYRAVLGEELDAFGTQMPAVGRALEKRVLVFANGLYAEYEATVDGEHYPIAYGNCGDGRWQLLRF